MIEHEQSSMLEWWPYVATLSIPQPKTMLIHPTDKELETMQNEMMPKSFVEKIDEYIEKHFSLPVFLRTDLASGKHDWKNTCFYDGSQKLSSHLLHIVQFNLCADIFGLPFKAFAIREFIPMASTFKAFYGEMPVNPERRYFISDGKVLCRHPYWIPGAIEGGSKYMQLPTNWRELLEEMNSESFGEVDMLYGYASEIAKCFDGYWSIDFCKSASGVWHLIDMAKGEMSWHPECRKKEKAD